VTEEDIIKMEVFLEKESGILERETTKTNGVGDDTSNVPVRVRRSDIVTEVSNNNYSITATTFPTAGFCALDNNMATYYQVSSRVFQNSQTSG
jgi:hypothetical protein